MRTPFPGMDPYMEHPALWPDVHNSLIAAIRDNLSARVAPHYYVRLERRTYLLSSDDLAFIGRPDVSVIPTSERRPRSSQLQPKADVIEIELPLADQVGLNYLEVHEVITSRVITVMELLSPANKVNDHGREDYTLKRESIFRSQTNLVEIDLLRAGKPMPMGGKRVQSDYRIMISRAAMRPRAYLYPFNLRDAIPSFPLPLIPGDTEPLVELGPILHALYERARYDLSLDYSQPPVPPLHPHDVDWATDLIKGAGI